MLEAETIRRIVERACTRADVKLDEYSLVDDKVRFTVSCERGARTFASSGVSLVTADYLEGYCYHTVVDWSD